MKRRRMELINECWISLVLKLWSCPKFKGNHLQACKEIQEFNISVIFVDFKDTQDQIAINWRHWRMQVFRGQKALKMTKEVGLVSNQEVEIMIQAWWTWWKWSVPSPLAWRTSLDGLKVLTLIPNPLGISPQTHVSCGWKGVHMHKHFNLSMH